MSAKVVVLMSNIALVVTVFSFLYKTSQSYSYKCPLVFTSGSTILRFKENAYHQYLITIPAKAKSMQLGREPEKKNQESDI